MPAILSTVSADNSIAVTQQLLNGLNIPFTFSAVEQAVKQHPDYPSISAVHEVLKEYKTENLVMQVEKENIDQLPVPFIAYMHGKPGGFITVSQVNDKRISYLKKGSLQKSEELMRSDFLKNWSGVALLAEKTENSGEHNYAVNRKKEQLQQIKLPALIGTVLLLIFLSFFYQPAFNGWVTAAVLLNLSGTAIACLLLWYEIDKNNPLLQKVCSGTKTTNCSAILESKDAKLFGIISWSEIGFFYFTGSLLAVLTLQEKALPFLAWLNLATLFYPFYSVYYQWWIAKQWCPLCLSVQVVLVVEAVVFFAGSWFQPLFNHIYGYYSVAVVFVLPVLFWHFIKPFLLKAKEGEEYKNRFFRMKKDSRIFEALLNKQKKINASTEGLGITLGSPQATNTIIKVCNPYCGPCAKAHPAIHKLLQENNNIKVQILFTATTDEKDYRNKPVIHLLAIDEKNDAALIDRALDDWYLADKKDYDVFAAKYPMNGELKQQEKRVKAMKDWCDKAKIEFTPTFFVNGYQLPENYNVDELTYFLSS